MLIILLKMRRERNEERRNIRSTIERARYYHYLSNLLKIKILSGAQEEEKR